MYYEIRYVLNFGKVIRCMYRILRNVPRGVLRQYPAMKHITVSAATRKHMHTIRCRYGLQVTLKLILTYPQLT